MIPLRRTEIDVSSNMCFIFFVLCKDWRTKEQNVEEKQTCCVYYFNNEQRKKVGKLYIHCRIYTIHCRIYSCVIFEQSPTQM